MEGERRNSEEKIPRDPIFGADTELVSVLNPEDVKKSIYGDGNRKPKYEIRNLEHEIRFRCLQGWFLRCSWSVKFEFIREICELTSGVFVLEQVLKCIDSVYSKDVIDSFARDRIQFAYDVVPTDDNRSLSAKELNVVKQEDSLWFLNLDSANQIEVIVTLLRIGGGGLIFSVHKEIDRLYREKREINAVLTAVDCSIREMEAEEEKPKDPEGEIKLPTGSCGTPDKYTTRKSQQISRRNAELNDFKKKYGIYEFQNGKIGNGKKKEVGEVVDYIQVLPLWLNRKIMLYLDERELAELKKTGKYWTEMIEDALRENNGRSIIDAKISKISGVKPAGAKGKEGEETGADFCEPYVLGREALLQEMHLKQRDLIRMQKENETLKGKKLKVDVWEEMCYEKLCCCVSEVFKLLASSTANKTVNFYSLRTGARTDYSVSGIPAAVTSMAIHEEGFHVVVGCEDGNLLNMNIRKNERILSYKGHSGAIIQMHVSDNKLISASEDGTIKHFDLWSGLCILSVNVQGSITSLLALERDTEPRRVLAGTAEGKLFFIDLKKKKKNTTYREVTVHDKEVRSLVEEKGILMTSSSDRTVRLWGVNNLEKIEKPSELMPFVVIRLESAANAVKFHGNLILAACVDGKVRLICKLSGTTVRVIEVTRKKPIMGIYVMQGKDTTKMIMWHESGIEMRAISFGKTSNVKKKKGRKKRRDKSPEEKTPIRSRRLFSVVPVSAMQYEVPERRAIKRFKATDSEDAEKVAVDRSCTVEKLRDSNPEEYETFTQDVFTVMLRKYRMLHPRDIQLETFPRLAEKNCGRFSMSCDPSK